jgi:ribosomal protein S18 acetylase RimI-like enzyme
MSRRTEENNRGVSRGRGAESVVIRPFALSDRELLRELTSAAFAGVSIEHNIDLALGPIAAQDWRLRKARHIDADIDDPGGEIAVAEDPQTGRTLGYVSMRFDRDARVGWLPNLAVDESVRGRGVGRQLLEHALDRFRAEGMRVARIETLEQNPIGRHLYPSLGFLEVARQIHYAIDLGRPQPQSPETS